MSLTCNVGGADKAIRFVLGLALLAVAVFAQIETHWRVLAAALALIALLTAALGFCPMNSLLGINTCKRRP